MKAGRNTTTPCAAVADVIAAWRLDEPSRFPVTLADWDKVDRVPRRPAPRVPNGHGYDLLINRKARRPVCGTMRKLIAAFPEDFGEAAALFKPAEWRLLFYLDSYPLSSAADPAFNPASAFRQIFDREPTLLDVPLEWTGSGEQAAGMLLDLRVTMSDASQDLLKAAWTILSFARSLGIEKNEVLMVPWWTRWWIDRYLAAVSR